MKKRAYYKNPEQQKRYKKEQEMVFRVIKVIPNIFTSKQKRFITKYYIYGYSIGKIGRKDHSKIDAAYQMKLRVMEATHKVINNYYTREKLDRFR